MKIILVIAAIIIVALSLFTKITTKEQNLSRQVISDQTVPSPTVTPSEYHPRLWLESSEVSPNNLYRATSYSTGDYDDRYHYYQVFITELSTDRMRRIYTGDFRTLGWEWTKDNKIKISYNCGTGCKSTRIIDVDEYVSLELDRSGKWTTETFKSF